jgi:hypothetical protein
MAGDDMDLRALLETLDPKAGDDLRRVLIHDQATMTPWRNTGERGNRG